MKKTLVISSLIIAGSIIYQSNSFTSSLLGQEVSYKVVSEEQALISISYDKMRRSFTLTNNTENNIKITNIHLDGNHTKTNESLSDPFILAGKSKEYFIECDTLHLTGEQMNISLTSENMEIEITSTLPQFIEKDEEVAVEAIK